MPHPPVTLAAAKDDPVTGPRPGAGAMGGVDSGRPMGRSMGGVLAARLATLVAALILAAGCAGPAPTVPPIASTTPLPSSYAPAPAASPTTPAPEATSQPGDDGAWTPVQPTGLPQPATLVPTHAGMDSVARTTAFLLTSLDARPAMALASLVVADPPVTFRVTSTGTSSALLRPATVLASATRYRFSLTRPDGTVEASWTARTAGPLHVTDTVPGDAATAVPVDTGVEITFDQAGVPPAAVASHFRISPSATGHFQVAGRSIAFTPDTTLRTGTLYTVTISHGLPLADTGEVLERDVVIRFETAAARRSEVRVWLADALVDATPRERAAMTLWTEVPEGWSEPTGIPVTVHRLAGLSTAMAAWTAITAAPDWTMVTAQEAVPTKGLPRVLSSNVRIQHLADGTRWIQLPRPLPTGWYVLTVAFAGVPRQQVLQITDTATYALVTSTSTAIWVNDLRTRGPGAGATASLAGTALSGSADGQGLLVAPTPATVGTGAIASPMLLVHYHGATTFRPIAGSSLCGGCDGKGIDLGRVAPDHWWTLLTTDRTEYRQTDTVNVVGVVKHRVSGDVPAAVRLTVSDEAAPAVPILARTVAPDERGMYAASLPISTLPIGSYRVRATVDGELTGESWFSVATIRKPAYLVTVTPERHALISGNTLRSTIGATFFDATPVAGASIRLTIDGSGGQHEATTTTDTTGQGTGTLRPTSDGGQLQVMTIRANPTLPEEASLEGDADLAVFAGNAFITLDGVATAKTVTLTGGVNTVAWSRYERPDAVDLWSVDPRGAPRPGAAVRVSVVAHYSSMRQTGTAYDFIAKRVVPAYEVLDKEVALPARAMTTGSKGTFRLVVSTIHNAYAYEVSATYTDESGHRITALTWVSGMNGYDVGPQPSLSAIDGHQGGTSYYSVGDTIRVRYTGGSATHATASRFLFVTLQQGLRGATVSSDPVFQTQFTSQSIPDVVIGAVRFNGAGYDPMPVYTALMDPRERQMTITMNADKARYEPGDTATVSVRTLDRSGRPVAASVFVRAVDEKLYAMGAAVEETPVDELYATVPDGVLGSARSHQVPSQEWGGGKGDTTGGGGTGGRTDFRDWLVAKLVHTDADGRATVTIPLSDDLTSWRVAATAVDGALDAGAGSVKLPVGLPFFADAILAPEYLVADRPVIRVRSYGSALTPGTRVTFAVSSDTLPMAETTVTADAFGSAYIALGALSVGTQHVRISARAVVDGQALADTLTRTFAVVTSRTTQRRTTWSPLTGSTSVQSGEGMTRLVLVDAGRGRVVPILEELAAPGGVRADEELASALANRVLTTQFGLKAVAEPDPNGLDAYVQGGDISIVPWGSPQLEVTALAAMADDPRLRLDPASSMLAIVATDASETRARRLLAIAGLAALGEPVQDQIAAAAAQTDLAVEEQVNLALAALEAGDEALAGRLEQELLAQHGLRLGHMVRIDAGAGADTTVVTARLAIVAASLGDSTAAEMDEYVAHAPVAVHARRPRARAGGARLGGPRRQLHSRGGAHGRRCPHRRDASVGRRDGVRLDSGARRRRRPSRPSQAQCSSIQTWDDALAPSTLATPDGVAFSRVVTPAGRVAADQTVIVEFHVTVPADQAGAGWLLVDRVPSGLAPTPYYGA